MRWYQTWWGVSLVGLGALVVFAIVAFGVVTFNFWRQIKNGQGIALQQEVYSGFTALQGGNQSTAKIDRNVLETGDFPYLGNPNAATVIVLFGDFRCPFTKEEWPIIQKLIDTYGYKVKLIFRNFPEESLHPGTSRLAQIGACAYDQGKYWNTHNYLFDKQDSLPLSLSDDDLANLATSTGLDFTQLKQCIDSSPASIKVNRDYVDGYKFGVAGTPTFFVNGQKLQGVVPWEVWDKLMKAAQ